MPDVESGIFRHISGNLLADASEVVYRRLRTYEPILLVVFQSNWPNRNIIKVTVVSRIHNPDARDAVGLGDTFRVFRRERAKDLTPGIIVAHWATIV